MTAIAYHQGHRIDYVDNRWVYLDNQLPVDENPRPCSHCRRPATSEGHDGCLSTLPGISNACCGHGRVEEAYIQFLDGEVVRGVSAFIIIRELKRYVELPRGNRYTESITPT